MSDDFEVTHGGVIAVDPDALRAVADAMVALAPRFADAASAARSAHAWLLDLPDASSAVDGSALRASADRADALHEECRAAGENIQLMADVYELVERRAELAALEVQGKRPTGALLDRVDELTASDPRILDMEKYLMAQWEKKRFEGLDAQLGGVKLPGPGNAFDFGILFGMLSRIGASGLGRLPPGATLSGDGGPVSVTAVKTDAPSGPPKSVADAFRRLPGADGAQIKVEKYTMPDGTKKFVLYEKGTQPPGEDEPFDAVESNLDLYTGEESASYAATIEALEASGAQAGDEVHVYAHSQGAMNAAYLSSQSEFDVTVQVTAGSPVHPAAAAGQLLIELRHTDDLVSSLAGGGLPGGSGSADSIVVTRDTDTRNLVLPAHVMESYIETAQMLDESGDVRMQAWREKSEELADAVSVESTEYVAKRE